MSIYLQATIVVLMVISILFYMWTRGMKTEVIRILRALVIEAEGAFGSGTGPLKYAYVIGYVYPLLPIYVKFFISEAKLDVMIEDAVKWMQNKLDESEKLRDAFYGQLLVSEFDTTE